MFFTALSLNFNHQIKEFSHFAPCMNMHSIFTFKVTSFILFSLMHRSNFGAHQHTDRSSVGNKFNSFTPNSQPTDWNHNDFMSEENDRLTHELTEKVTGLRSLSIRIGDELREQNSLLGGMAGAFDRSEGMLRSTMSRVFGLGKHSSSTALYCYLLCFASLVFFVCWLLLKFRWWLTSDAKAVYTFFCLRLMTCPGLSVQQSDMQFFLWTLFKDNRIV